MCRYLYVRLFRLLSSKQWLLGFLLVLLVPILSGCWDRLEIEDRAVILGLAIDPMQKDEVESVTGPSAVGSVPGYKITAQVAIPGRISLGPGEGSAGGSSERPVWVLTATGKTFDDAMNILQKDLADRIFLGHLGVIIINQKLGQEQGIKDLQDYLRRNAEVRRLAWMVISEGEAKQTMEAAPKLERVPTLYLSGTLDHAVQLGKIPNEFLGKFWSDEDSLGEEPVLPLISVKDSERISLEGLALFKEYRLVGTANPLETMAYMQLTNQRKGGYALAVPMQDGNETKSVSLRATNRSTRIRLHPVNGQPNFSTYTRIEINIEESTSREPLQNQIPTLEHRASTAVMQKQEEFLLKLKALRTDSIGFGERVRGEDNGFWRQNVHSKSDWDKCFAQMPIHCSVKTFVRRAGMKAR